MKTENVQSIIRDLAYDNFNMYHECYPLNEDGTATDEASMAIQDLASNYFDNRQEAEIERDEALGITEIDYVDWCLNVFSNHIANSL